MSALESIGSGPLVTALGWALVHFIWQGTLIAAALAAALYLMRGRTANARYAAGCAAMGLMVLAPVVTFVAVLGAGFLRDLHASLLPAAVRRPLYGAIGA